MALNPMDNTGHDTFLPKAKRAAEKKQRPIRAWRSRQGLLDLLVDINRLNRNGEIVSFHRISILDSSELLVTLLERGLPGRNLLLVVHFAYFLARGLGSATST